MLHTRLFETSACIKYHDATAPAAGTVGPRDEHADGAYDTLEDVGGHVVGG